MSSFARTFATVSATLGSLAFASNLRADFLQDKANEIHWSDPRYPAEPIQAADTGEDEKSNEISGTTEVIIGLVGVAAAAAACGIVCATRRNSIERLSQNLGDFKEFPAELDFFNQKHTTLSGLDSHCEFVPDTGEETPLKSHHATFIESWTPFLTQRGLALSSILDKAGSGEILNARIEVRLDNLRKFKAFVASIPDAVDYRLGALTRNFWTAILQEVVEHHMCNGFIGETHSVVAAKVEDSIQTFQEAFKKLGAHRTAEALSHYVGLAQRSSDAFAEYAGALRKLHTTVAAADSFYVSPQALESSLSHANRFANLVQRDELLYSYGTKLVQRIDSTIEILASHSYDARGGEDTDDYAATESDGGGIILLDDADSIRRPTSCHSLVYLRGVKLRVDELMMRLESTAKTPRATTQEL